MIEDNILLITDDDEVAESILSKLVLLRESDSIAVCNYEMSRNILKNSGVSIVIIHEHKDKKNTFDLIKDIKSSDYDLILLVNRPDKDFILSAYDEGVKDYFAVESEPYEMLIRTINCFKAHAVKAKLCRDNMLLRQLDVIDEETGFYKYKFSKELLTEFLKDKKIQNGMFVILSLDEESKTRFSADKLAKAIKSSVRCDDIVFIVRGGKFYIILPNIDKSGTFAVLSKIQNTLGLKMIIRAGISRILNKSFERIEKECFAGMSEACQKNETAVFLEEKVKTLDEWLDDDEKSEKNFKLFKNAYNNKLEKVIAPVFFRLQKTYEEKLFNTKVNQYTDELQSVFHLKHKTQEGRLKILYPGFAKIVINISYEGLESPENSEITLNLNEVTQESLAKIVESFIKEFKKAVKD